MAKHSPTLIIISKCYFYLNKCTLQLKPPSLPPLPCIEIKVDLASPQKFSKLVTNRRSITRSSQHGSKTAKNRAQFNCKYLRKQYMYGKHACQSEKTSRIISHQNQGHLDGRFFHWNYFHCASYFFVKRAYKILRKCTFYNIEKNLNHHCVTKWLRLLLAGGYSRISIHSDGRGTTGIAWYNEMTTQLKWLLHW